MTLTPEDVKKIEKVGDSDKGEILHVLTKGGMNLIVQKTRGGALNVLGQGSHRAFAIHQASQIHKNIQWSDTLMKSEDMKDFTFPKEVPLMKQEPKSDAMGNPLHESTPQNHYDLATHHSKMAGKSREMERAHKANPATPHEQLHDSRMRQLMHSDIALKHYEMSGLSGSDSKREHEKHMDLHHEMKDGTNPPFQEYALQLAWQRANPTVRAPKGLGNWSE